MTHLKQLAELGRVVVTAIHQPRSAIWNLFDTVRAPLTHYGYIMCATGEIVAQLFRSPSRVLDLHHNEAVSGICWLMIIKQVN
jgi:hypothetical protein